MKDGKAEIKIKPFVFKRTAQLLYQARGHTVFLLWLHQGAEFEGVMCCLEGGVPQLGQAVTPMVGIGETALGRASWAKTGSLGLPSCPVSL